MAQNETWLNHDFMQAVKVQYLDGNVFTQDNAGNLIGVHLTRDGVDYSGGGSVAANVIRADGATIAVSGAISGANATVVLPQSAYAIPGVLSIVIKLTVNGEITTIGAVVANVYQSSTDTTVDPGTIIPSIETLIAAIEAAIATIPADYSDLWACLAPVFSSSTSYEAGRYVTYDGNLYKFLRDHSGAWDADDVSTTTLGTAIYQETQNRTTAITNAINTEVSNRNSAINSAIAQEVTDRNAAIASAISQSETDVYDRFVNDAVQNGLSFTASWDNSAIHDFGFKLPAGTPVKVSFISTTDSSFTSMVVYGVKTDNTLYSLGSVPLGEIRTFKTSYTNDSIRLTANPYSGSTHGTIVCNVQVSSVTKSLLQITNQDRVSFSNTRTVFEKKDVSAGEKYRIYVWNVSGDESASITAYLFKTDSTYTIIPRETIGNTQYFEATMPSDISYIRLYANVGTAGTLMAFDYAFVKVGGGILDVLENKLDVAQSNTNALIDITDNSRATFSYSRTIFEKHNISPGETYRIYVKFESEATTASVGAYLFKTDTSSTTLAKEIVSGVQYYDVTIPDDADFIRLYGDVGTSGTAMTVEYIFVKVGGKILDVMEENLESGQDDLRLFASQTKSICKIFKKVCCCGDSYTAGYIDIGSGASNNPLFSWPFFMSTATGNEYVNCGVSGANVFVWMANVNGLAKAQNSGKAQLYIIDLLRNDASESDRHVDVGTVADIGTDAQTYYGGMSKLIREINAINPTAKIFVNCIPSAYIGFRDYNTAIRTICETYKNTYPVHCIDLEQYRKFYVNGAYADDYIHGHETAIGYEVFAENYAAITSKYIADHVQDFQDVYTIPYT